MKCLMNFKKPIIQFIIVLSVINIVHNFHTSVDVNPYRTMKSVKHSLFRERDSGSRMSSSPEGVPQKIE